MPASFDDVVAALIAEGKTPEQARAIAASKCGLGKSFTRDLTLALPICKFSDEQQTVTGWAALSTDDDGHPVVDFQDEYIPVSELEKVAHELVAAGGAGHAGEMHERRSGDLVESMVFTADKAGALFPELKDVKKSGWAVTMRVDDAAWANYKSGKRPELSLHGLAAMTPVGKRDGRTIYMRSDLQVDEISIVDRGASGNDRVQPRIVLAKRATGAEEKIMPAKSKTPDVKAEALAEVKKALENLSKAGLESLVELESAGFSDEQKQIVYALLEAAKGAQPAAKSPPAVSPAEVEKDKAPPVPLVAKRDDPEVKPETEKPAALVEMEKRHAAEKAALEKRVDELEKSRKDLEAKQELAEMTKRAAARPYIAKLSTEEQAQLLVEAKHGLKPETYEKLDKVFDAINEGMSKSDVLKQIGSDKQGESNSAAAKLNEMAKQRLAELRKSVDGKRATFAQVFKAVCEENPALYDEMSKEENAARA